MRIWDMLIIQYFICFAGIFYGLYYKSINVIILFGCSMIINAVLQLRVKKYLKEQKKF